MIREQQHWTSSELIYLFVDGEADDVQQSLLFSALANDAGLQAEFSDALRINGAIKEAGLEEHPPQHVTAALFEKAGFGTAPEQTLAGAGGIFLSGGKGLLSSVRSIAVPLVSAFVGGVIALFFAPEILQQPTMQAGPTVAAYTAPTQIAPQVLQQPSGNSAPDIYQTTETIAQESKGSARLPRAAHSSTQGNIRAYSSSTTTRSGEAEHQNTAAEQAQSPQNEGIAQIGGNSESQAIINPENIPFDTAAQLQVREVTSSVEPIPALPQKEAAEAAPTTQLNEGPLALLQSTAAIDYSASFVQEPRFALQVRGMADIEMFPHRSLSTGEETVFENIAVTGFYNVSRNHSIGIEIGREYHPLYMPTTTTIKSTPVIGGTDPNIGIGITINSNGGSGLDLQNTPIGIGSNVRTNTNTTTPTTPAQPSTPQTTTGFRLEPRSAWFGMAYQFRANPIDRLGLIRPFAQAMVGGTEIGPVGKGTVGLSWTPDSRVAFNVGLEGTAILYRNNNDWYSSRKLGIAYSAQINF